MMRRLLLLTALPCMLHGGASQHGGSSQITIRVEAGEGWWGGLSVDGAAMPYGVRPIARDLDGENRGNQAQPLLLSSHGRYVWSAKPFAYEFANAVLTVRSKYGALESGRQGRTLKEVFAYVSRKYFPPSGKLPDPVMFQRPQYNTWIELMYDQNQADVLKYAQSISDRGYPPGVLMIDDNWQEDYGNWEFSARRFADPKAMMARLHALGFRVMLWVVPFVSPDSAIYRDLARQGLLLRESPKREGGKTEPALIRWWNGASAVLDGSNPKAIDWLDGRLRALVERYGVDGFKFDAGDAPFYAGRVLPFSPVLASEQTELFARLGLRYPLNEFRASWKMAGQPLAQRLRDKRHNWDDLRELIPGIVAQGLMGYAFTCPDLIGGGEFQSFLDAASVDQELVVRSAQCSALMPMMQFSVAPWRVLDTEKAAICQRMAKLHDEHGQEILQLAEAAARDGEPIVRALAYEYPQGGFEAVNDEFLLGTRILVAPVLEKGARKRTVRFPAGRWQGDDGTVVVGPRTAEIEAPLARLPWYRKLD